VPKHQQNHLKQGRSQRRRQNLRRRKKKKKTHLRRNLLIDERSKRQATLREAKLEVAIRKKSKKKMNQRETVKRVGSKRRI